ncbi:short-chain dehydrogenase/reductase [Stigmatella aurantiaca]|uniref:Short-chain dehydrogenase/reductase SDR n=1 Tax=Stigmatella aurantiaca (strain DW4/3-1) TaxID=378806 RepID=E3FF07_STIAD|nr:short-chain dehydrogenase/reductase [Stigmatella aurantiaca]ADO70188.1 Short-chain dehydrogenase/reductase SDR [Stigmatella aurantiaca DW4/3-1]
MSFDLEMKDRRALVTGGAKGVGAAGVTALREAGARVVATARSVPSDADGVHDVAADSTTAEGCALVAREALAHLGGIDRLMAAVRLDRALLPWMLAQRSGVIVHVTSIEHELPLPESTTDGGTVPTA